MSGKLVLGIDGGGSKLLVALADQSGQVIQTARGGGVNPMDNPDWRSELQKHIEPFRNEGRLAGVAAALPAYGEVAQISRLLEEFVDMSFPRAVRRVLNDVDAAHLGAFAGKPGILILSGTGSMAWARDAQGQASRAGGWGDLIGDEGSSYWIGRRVLNRVSQSFDGRSKPTDLAKAIFDTLQLDLSTPMDSLCAWAASLDKPRSGIATLARVVGQCADQGNSDAIELLENAAEELAKHYFAVAKKGMEHTDWTYAGGTFSSPVLLSALERRIGRPAVAPKLSPIGGALLAAAQRLDWSIDDDWIGHVAASGKAAFAQSK